MSELAKMIDQARLGLVSLENTITQQAEEIETLKRGILILTKDRDDWKSTFEMYRNAWLREIGGVIRNKAHEIDGFVLRTQDVYEGYRKWQAHVQAHLEKEKAKNVETGKTNTDQRV